MNARRVSMAVAALLSACSSAPLPPDWQLQARPALESAVSAQLLGDSGIAQREFERARALLARTGQPGLVARGELMRCAALVASLDFAPCDGFERLRADAPASEQAYADHLAGRALAPGAIELLPPAQRATASAIASKAAPASLQTVDDPLSRLIAAAPDLLLTLAEIAAKADLAANACDNEGRASGFRILAADARAAIAKAEGRS